MMQKFYSLLSLHAFASIQVLKLQSEIFSDQECTLTTLLFVQKNDEDAFRRKQCYPTVVGMEKMAICLTQKETRRHALQDSVIQLECY